MGSLTTLALDISYTSLQPFPSLSMRIQLTPLFRCPLTLEPKLAHSRIYSALFPWPSNGSARDVCLFLRDRPDK